jgi:hypothetical protein
MKEELCMDARKKHTGFFWFRVFVLALLVLVGAWLSLAVQATHADGLPLPPRPVFETPVPETGSGPTRPVGGWIQLQAQGGADLSQWVDVQWQDSLGVWHTVDSWHGQFDQVMNGMGVKTWWVDRYTFGPTPFRWIVYDSSGKNVLITSASFNLPTQNQQTVVVSISLSSK